MSDDETTETACFDVQFARRSERGYRGNKTVTVVTRGNADRACALVMEQNPGADIHQIIKRSAHKEVILDV